MIIKNLCQVKIYVPRVGSPDVHRSLQILVIESRLGERGQSKYLATSMAKGWWVKVTV